MRRQEGDDHDPVVSILDDSDSDANALKPAENPQVSRVTLHNVAHRHFPWCRFRARLTAAVGRKGKCQFSASTTESDDEPIMWFIVTFRGSRRKLVLPIPQCRISTRCQKL